MGAEVWQKWACALGWWSALCGADYNDWRWLGPDKSDSDPTEKDAKNKHSAAIMAIMSRLLSAADVLSTAEHDAAVVRLGGDAIQ